MRLGTALTLIALGAIPGIRRRSDVIERTPVAPTACAERCEKRY